MARRPRTPEERIEELEVEVGDLKLMVTEIHGLMTKSTIHILDAQGRTMREIATDIGRPYTFVRKVLRG